MLRGSESPEVPSCLLASGGLEFRGSWVGCPGGSRHCRVPPKELSKQKGQGKATFSHLPHPQHFHSPRRVAQWPGKLQQLISSCSCDECNIARVADAEEARTDPGRDGCSTAALTYPKPCTMQGSAQCWGEARVQQLGIETWLSLGSPGHGVAGCTTAMTPLCSPRCGPQLLCTMLVWVVGLISGWLGSPTLCSTWATARGLHVRVQARAVGHTGLPRGSSGFIGS